MCQASSCEGRPTGYVNKFLGHCFQKDIDAEAFRCHQVCIKHQKQKRKGSVYRSPASKSKPCLGEECAHGNCCSRASVDHMDTLPMEDELGTLGIPPLSDADLFLGKLNFMLCALRAECVAAPIGQANGELAGQECDESEEKTDDEEWLDM